MATTFETFVEQLEFDDLLDVPSKPDSPVDLGDPADDWIDPEGDWSHPIMKIDGQLEIVPDDCD